MLSTLRGFLVSLFAGAGIVEGSDAAEEVRETDLKIRGISDTLLG